MDDESGRSAPARVLIVEDEALIAMELAHMVEELGHDVLGPAPSVAAALSMMDADRPDAALLDESLRGQTVAPVAARLSEEEIPFVVISGQARSTSSDPVLSDARRLAKPVTNAQLAAGLAGMLPR
jgi:two-component SAPR family response regulator